MLHSHYTNGEIEALGVSGYCFFCSFDTTVSKVSAPLLFSTLLLCAKHWAIDQHTQSQRNLKGWVLCWRYFLSPMNAWNSRREQFLPLNCCIGINLSHPEPSHIWWLSSGLALSVSSGVLGFFFLQWGYLLVEGSYQRNPYKTAASLKILATKRSKIHLRILHTIPAMFSVHLSGTFIFCCFSELLYELLVQFSPSKLLYHSFNLEVLSWAVIWNFITKRFFGYRTFTFIISILFLNAWEDWYINGIRATPGKIFFFFFQP